MAKRSSGKKTSPIIYYLVGAGVVALLYVYTSGDDSSSTKTTKPPAANKAPNSTADAFLPIDYKASYPPLKLEVKDAFLPLIRKAPISAAGSDGKNLPSAITGGGDWAFGGTVTVNNQLQGLLDEAKTGESDFVTVGEHWKHGRIKRISDSEIVISGDDGTSATMKVGEPTAAAPKPPPSVAPLNPASAMQGQIGMDVSPLPDAGGSNFNFGNGGGGRRGRGGGRRGRGGFGGFGG